MNYPEHEKRAEVKDDIQVIGDFLEWIDQKGLLLCSWVSKEILDECVPINKSFDDLIYEYFNIDRDLIESERKAVLEAITRKETE